MTSFYAPLPCDDHCRCYFSGSNIVADTTTADYNELSQMASTANPYSWAGKIYTTQSAFNSASGQGAHDEVEQYIDPMTDTEPTGAGVADANPSAPGELSTDLYGNTWPGTAPDRGAVAVEEFTGATLPDASNLNYYTGQTVPNLVMVATDGGTPVNRHNGSTGTVDLIAALFG